MILPLLQGQYRCLPQRPDRRRTLCLLAQSLFTESLITATVTLAMRHGKKKVKAHFLISSKKLSMTLLPFGFGAAEGGGDGARCGIRVGA